ncbi:MAG: family 78 glycoside hydrolase catalytic domain [Firmicutes bacterium]|nr:family 78 glycoside hydrolase catalytic domain [Bacillota bacterium]
MTCEPKFICHPDFSELAPVNVFHKENLKTELPEHPDRLKNRHILFRKKTVLGSFGQAKLKISADDHFKLYINGKYVTEGPAPSYPSAYYFCELDVTEFLNRGENIFAVHTYYQGLINRVWVSGDLRQMLFFELQIDGKTVCVSDTDWKCRYHSGYTECGKIGYDTAFAECYDSSSPEAFFYRIDFDDSDWKYAAVFKNADYSMVKQPTEQLVYSEIEPKTVEKTDFGLRLDFGQEAVGYLYAVAKGKSGDTVLMRFGEEQNDDGGVRYKLRCNCNYEEKWILSGKTDTLMQYDYKAFRYAELYFSPDTEIIDVKMTVRHYPFELKARYRTDIPDLNRIINLCADTVKYGTQEVFVDCPTREKGQYLGDASVSARAHAALTGDTRMFKKAVTDFCRSSFICPGIMAVSTSSLMQEIADYSLQLPAMICWIYSIDRDIEFVRAAEPFITNELDYFRKYMRGDGLLDFVNEKWNLVDWPDNFRDGYDFPLTKPIGKGVHNVLNAFWYGFLKSADELYSLVGKPETGLTARVALSFENAFYSEKTGLYCDSERGEHSAVHSNVLPLLFGLCDSDTEKLDRIVHFIESKGLTSMGVYMSYFALAALVRAGKSETAYKMTLSPGCWLNMLSEGATTTFEAWGKNQKWNTSLFHPWATAPLIVFADGIRPY